MAGSDLFLSSPGFSSLLLTPKCLLFLKGRVFLVIFCFVATPGVFRAILLILTSGIIPGNVQGTILGAGD